MRAERAFTLPLGNGPVSGQPPSAVQSGAVAELLALELERYPPAFLRRCRLKRVLLVSGLSEASRSIPSLPNTHQTLLLDVEGSPAYTRRLIHHELYHFADYAMDDQVQRDPAWEKLNDRWFVYGTGGRAMRDPRTARLRDDLPGFVTKYATSALEEDKAETFAFMLAEPAAFERIAARDPILRKKRDALRRELSRWSPALDDAFWHGADLGH